MIISDEQLPQIGDLLNPSAMGSLFNTLADSSRVEECRIVRVKYRPGKNCLVTYHLQITDLQTGKGGEQTITLLACRRGESHIEFVSARKQPLVATSMGEGILHLLALEAVAWIFPNDRKLIGLPAVVDPERLKSQILPEVVAINLGAEWEIVELADEVIHYVAERGCTVRAILGLRNARTGTGCQSVLFGKTYCLDEGAAAWLFQQYLWESEARRRGRLLIPQPITYQPEIKTVWQSMLNGKNLSEYDNRSVQFCDWLEKAGVVVATLHQVPMVFAPLNEMSVIGSKLKASAELLSRARPALRTTLSELVDRLIDASRRIEERPVATLHGDLHLKNFLVEDDHVALVDLDNLCQGDPLQDVGSFAAAIHYRGLLESRPFPEIEEVFHHFLRTYRENVCWKVSEAELSWHTAAALIYERAHRCVTRLKAGRLEILDGLIDLSQHFSRRL